MLPALCRTQRQVKQVGPPVCHGDAWFAAPPAHGLGWSILPAIRGTPKSQLGAPLSFASMTTILLSLRHAFACAPVEPAEGLLPPRVVVVVAGVMALATLDLRAL